MSTDTWILQKNVCRCCHSEGSFMNLSEPCSNFGQEEIYSEMLRHSLNIDMSPLDGALCELTYTICEVCVLKLRDANNFKKQVLDCEERLRDMLNRNLIQVYSQNDEVDIKQELHEDNISAEEFEMDNDDDDELLKLNDEGEKNSISCTKRTKLKSKTEKVKKTKKVGRPCKIKVESENEGEVVEESKTVKKKGRRKAAKFRLCDDDFTKDGEKYQCRRCLQQYDKMGSLRYHVKTKHFKIPLFQCQYCEKEFMTPAPLTVHKLEVHNIDERFKCNACKGTFNTKVQLRKHIKNFHMLGERVKCDLCDYESFSFEGLYKHKFKHKTVKDFHCRFCKKSFLRKSTLDLHERIHTGDRRKVCKECGQAFVQKASLNYHMTKYHPEVNF